MATLLKVLNNLADTKSAGGVALRVRTQEVRDWWTGRARIERETTQNSRRLIVGVAGWFK
jgi:hypothetical protein